MSDTYTKLFSSITASTIVSEPVATRWAWVTMLAAVKPDGVVYGSVPGLARLANLTIEETRAALVCFLGPDPDSRTQANEGRRVEEVDGGWRLLNHAKYDEIRNSIERAEYKREWDRKNRPSGHARQSDSPIESDRVRQSGVKPDSPAASTSASIEAKSSFAQQAARFDEFWTLYPSRPGTSKSGKKPCLTKWKARDLDRLADVILADVAIRIAKDKQWLDGYCPDPLTYINQDRWADGFSALVPVTNGSGNGASPKKPETAKSHIDAVEAWAGNMRDLGAVPEAEIQAQVDRVRARYGA